jgi:hypothetical protein
MPEDPHIEAAYVACDIERTALRAEVEQQREAITNMVDKNAQLCAEVERLKVARDGFYDDTVALRKESIALRELLRKINALAHSAFSTPRHELLGAIAELSSTDGVPTDAFNKWTPDKAKEFNAQAVDVIHYLQGELAKRDAGG